MTFAHLCGDILCIFLGLLGGTILVLIWVEKIDLSDLINEANGRASMSRFQLLVFTFVIAISLFEVVENRKDSLPDIPSGILTLLGISASTYAVSKGIQASSPALDKTDKPKTTTTVQETVKAQTTTVGENPPAGNNQGGQGS